MPDETTRVDAWLHATLTGDATLVALLATGAGYLDGVYKDEAPAGAGYPFVRFGYLGGVDVEGQKAHRILHSGLWLVAGVAQAREYDSAIADRLDVLLHRASGTADDGIIFSSTRDAPFRLSENDEGTDYRHLGGQYRILCQVPPSAP